MTNASQNTAILAHLQKGLPLTPLQALELFGCLRLGARVYDLRRQGYQVESEPKVLDNGKRVASYRMVNA